MLKETRDYKKPTASSKDVDVQFKKDDGNIVN